MQRNRVKKHRTIRTWEEITPPYPQDEYECFKDCDKYPFRYDSNVFDMVNAWWLIDAAILSYDRPGIVKPVFKRAGLPNVKFFSGKETDTECYVAHNSQFAIVTFRGTESWIRAGEKTFKHIFADIRTDINIKLVESGQGGRVHEGFKNALDDVWTPLSEYLRGIHAEGFKVWVTGHSLGGALATLMADRYGVVQGLYTFGSPRVGDESFKEDFFVNAYRFVNNGDIISRVPPAGFYQHVGNLKYIDSDGIVYDNPTRWERLVDVFEGQFDHLYNSLGKLREGFFQASVPDPIIDHVPTFYAVHIWNNIS